MRSRAHRHASLLLGLVALGFCVVSVPACGEDEAASSAAAGSSAAGGSAGKSGAAGRSAGGANAGGANAGTGGNNAGTGGSSAGIGGSSAGIGGSSAGIGGSSAGIGGSSAGTAGSNAGAAGSNAGAGGGSVGTAGSSAGTGGSTAGTGGSSAGAGGGNAGGAGAGGQPSNAARWLMAYYPGYQQNDLPEADIPFGRLTHLAVGAVLPRSDGTLDTAFYKSAETGPAFAKALAKRTHEAGKKAILMVGGAGAHDGFVAAAGPAQRAKFVGNLVAFAKENGFDGLDLDWEPLPKEELPAFGELAKALRAAWPDAILTLPITPLNVNFEQADPQLATIAASLDQINVMTYAMAGAYEGWKSWHHTPLRGHTAATPMSVESSVDAFLFAGVPAKKLGIGEGFYGLCYTSPVTAPGQDLGGAQAIADDNVLAYRTLLATYAPVGTKKWDDVAKSAYLTFAQPTGPEKCTYLSFTEEQGIGEHAAYVKSKGLGGAIVWTINEGHLPSGSDRDPLMTALWNGLQ